MQLRTGGMVGTGEPCANARCKHKAKRSVEIMKPKAMKIKN